MRLSPRALLSIGLVLGACGPSGGIPGDDDAGGGNRDGSMSGRDGGIDMPPDGPVARPGTITGRVWAPGNAPGMVPAGEEIPIAGAVIYVRDEAPTAFPDGAYCDPCQDLPPNAVVSDVHGYFQVPVTAGAHKLVIDKAQFRRVESITVAAEEAVELPAAKTTLPSKHDPSHGQWIPHIALAIADSDHVEDILAKMGFVDVNASGRAVEASFGRTDWLDLYAAIENDVLWDDPGPPPFESQHKGSISDLFTNVNRMKRYHIIFVPCNYDSDVSWLMRADVRRNIQEYVAAGGKLYITDWSAEWEDAAFPDFIQLDDTIDTTAAMVASNTINVVDGDFGHFSRHSSAADPILKTWLDGQKGPLIEPTSDDPEVPGNYVDGVIDADDFVIEGAWTLIRGLPTVTIGTDMHGNPIRNTAKTWISGDYLGQQSPHTVTFEPSCGRVLYSTYHTADKTHRGLVPQERVLLYLIMEIGVCNPIEDPG